MKLVVATLLTVCAFSVYGGPPSKTSLYGVELGSTLRQVVDVLITRYPNCEAQTTGFTEEVRTEGVERFSVSIEPGDSYRNCTATQPSSARTGTLAIHFLSKEVDAVGGAYEVWFEQYFNPRQSPSPTIGELLGRLTAEYGELTEMRSEQHQAMGVVDIPIKNLFYYELHAIWYNKALLKSSPCTAATCSGSELSAYFTAHAPPGKNAADLPAGSMRVVLRDVRLNERQKDWYVKKVGAKK